MLQQLKNRMRSQKGFTLIELVVVVAILGILAAILMPKVLDAMNGAKQKGSISTGKQLQVAMERINIANNDYPAVPTTVDKAWLNTTLGAYVAIDTNNISAVTYAHTHATSGDTYTLTVTFADTGKVVTVTPTSVTSN